MMNQYSGILIPIVALLIPIVAIIAAAFNQAQQRRLRADQQMAMIARGVPLAEIEAFLQRVEPVDNNDRPIKDPVRSLGNARRTATVLISLGIGLIVFFLIFGCIFLTHIDHEAGWVFIAVSAAGLIPLAIGIGFLFDYNLQKRELSRFGLEVGAEKG
jgi:hypothetical protein